MIPLRRRLARAITALLTLLAADPAAARLRVEIEGIGGVERDNVESRLSILAQAQLDDGGLDEARVRRLHQQAPADIREALQPFGYYEPDIDSQLDGAAPDWVARYRIRLGAPTTVAEVDAKFEGEGAEFEPLNRRLRWTPLRLEQRLLHADYEATKKRMSDAVQASGFLDARWSTAQLRVDPALREARAVLRLDTGPRYFFGPVSVQQDQLDPDVVQRYVALRQGQPFDSQALLDQQFRLGDLGYFQSVEIEPLRDQTDANNQVPLLIRTTPRPRSKYDFGVGYGTDTGARLSTGFDRRWLNRRGHVLETDLRLSEIKNTITASYRIPLGQEPGESLSFTAANESERLDAGETLKYLIGASLNRAPGDWQRRLYLEFAHEESEFGDAFTTADLLTPGVSFTRSKADDPVHTRRGWYLFADVHGALQNVLSSASFVQTRVIGRGVYALSRRWRLLGRAEFGYSLVEEFNDLPSSQRFFAGGDQSVRGYKYQTLGPRDDSGRVIGGRYLSVFSAESEYRVWRDWGAALFVDTGGADDDPGPRLSTGIGAGLRYRVPIGSLQLDLAHPLDEEDGSVRVHIGVRVGV